MGSRKQRQRSVEPLIRRIDHNFFHGFAVRIKRGEQRWSKLFSDKPDGRAAALRRARAYRDDWVARLPPPTKIKRTSVVNTTGEIGVVFARDRTRAGNISERYLALWPIKGGRQGRKSFSVAKYGKREACRLAIAARRKGVADYLESLRSPGRRAP